MGKEYKLTGGNGTTIEELEVTEDGTYTAGDSRAFNPVIVRTGGGGGGGALIVEMVWDESTTTFTLDTKAGVIFDAAKTGPVIFQEKKDGEVVNVYLLLYCYGAEGTYGFYTSDSGFTAASADDYPISGS